MSRFRFSLESVLRLKRQSERLAELRELQARSTVALRQRQLDELQRQLAELAAEMSAKVGRCETVSNWAVRFEQSRGLSERLRSAAAALAQAEVALRDASRERVRLAREVETLRVLREKQAAEHRKEQMRRDQIGVDELAMRRWTSPPMAG